MNTVSLANPTLLTAEQNGEGALPPTKPPEASEPRNLRLFKA
jgi:hypothetical protein